MAARTFIFVTVVLDMLGIGMIVPVLPRLVEHFVDGDAVRAAAIFGVFGSAWALMQFVFSPVMGALSDRFGRRPVILLSNLGAGLDYVLMALAQSLPLLFLGRVISGITAASISTASAYIADVTPPAERAAAFGMIGVAFGLGFVIGPAVGGLLGSIDPRLPFWFAAGLSLANATYGLLVLPESLPPERRSPFTWRSANPVGALTMLGSHRELFDLAMVTFLSTLAHGALPSMFVLYTGYRYGWDERTVGLTLAAVGVCSMIVQGGVVRPLVARFGERAVLLTGMWIGVAGFLAHGLAPTGTWFVAGVPCIGLWGMAGAALQGLMTTRVGASAQGQLQGAIGSVRGIAELIGPLVFTFSFSFAIAPERSWHLPGTPFLLAAAMLATGAVVGARATRLR